MSVSSPKVTDSGTTRMPRRSTRSTGRSQVESVTTATPRLTTGPPRHPKPTRRTARSRPRASSVPGDGGTRPRAAGDEVVADPCADLGRLFEMEEVAGQLDDLDPRGRMRQPADARLGPLG